ncbi:MAG: polyphosphate kinase 1, partial [Spirochaetaceae bacterium]|nr:polyphosphate kinase 1 [Spirochaetaceae bacterium]
MRPIYFNRELSWLDFNTRVLEEALRSELAALERYKFLTIVSSNFDEFFMVRMAAIKRTTLQNNARHCYNGAHNIQYNITENHASKKLCRKARKKTQDIIKRQYNCLMNDVFPTLAKNGLQLVSMNKWDELQKQFIKKYVIDKVFPYLNPLSLKSKTHISGETLYAAFLLHQNEERKNIFEIVIVKIPDCRIIMLPYGGDGVCRCFLLEQAVQYFAPYLFPGCFIKESMLLKIDREADFSIDNENNENFIKVMEKVIVEREYSRVIRMTYSAGSKFLRDEFARHLKLEPDDIYLIYGPLHLANLASLYDIG